MLAEIIGPSGSVTGIDVDGAQLDQAAAWCAAGRLHNVNFVEAHAGSTGLPRNSFDIVYCRFLLLHLAEWNSSARAFYGPQSAPFCGSRSG
jgi:ubiquinone/menaquinone biosynthesis C-methylase UbiE